MDVMTRRRDLRVTPGVLVLWLLYSGVYFYLKSSDKLLLSGVVSLAGEAGLDLLIGTLAFFTARAETGKIKLLFIILATAFFIEFLADAVYNYFLNIRQVPIGNMIDSLFDIPFAIFLFLCLLGWITVFDRGENESISKWRDYLSYFLAGLLILLVFIFGVKWKIHYFSLIGFYQILDTVLEATGFVFSAFCLIRAKVTWLKYLSVGYLVLIASDFIIRYGVVENSLILSNPFETSWVLGLLLMAASFFKKNKSDSLKSVLLHINCLQSQIGIWLFNFCILILGLFLGVHFLIDYLVSSDSHISVGDLPSIIVIFLIISAISSNVIARFLLKPFNEIKNIIELFNNNFYKPAEIKLHASNVEEFRNIELFLLESLQVKNEKFLMEKHYAEEARQVAHDIRSPLGALQVIAANTKHLPEQERTILRSAITRINDIAHNLLAKYKKGSLVQSDEVGVQPEIIYFLLEAVLAEKRLLLPAQRIDFIAADVVIPLCANVNDSEFKRVLSNILNNAIEATEAQTDGKVTVQLLQQDEQIVIEVRDNGCGIASDLIPKILHGGVSVGKAQGSGLGISSAIKMIAGWGGRYDLQSQIGQGTTFRIYLPCAPAPLWFTAQISLRENTAVYVVDDDETVHFVWRERFGQIAGDFYRPAQLIHFMQHTPASNALFLIDYEFADSELTGLALIRQLQLSSQAILVTSRYEDPLIRTQAIEVGVKIIPKLYAQHIPILPVPSAQTIVLLDDDHSLTEAWQLRALLTGKTLRTYNTAEALWRDLPQFNSNTLFYIDVELGEEENGLTVTRKLYEHGYSEIYLTSGHEASYFTEPLPWLKGMVGKAPPF